MTTYVSKQKSNDILNSSKFLQNLPKINCILAMDEEMGIGKNNQIPWKIKSDMDYFKNITTMPSNKFNNSEYSKNVLIMGKNTWNSIPIEHRPLKNRINIILSSTSEESNIDDLFTKNNFSKSTEYTEYNEFYFKNLENALNFIGLFQKVSNIGEIFICGGKNLYETVFNKPWMLTGKLYITHVKGKYETDTKVNFNDYFFKCLEKDDLPCGSGTIKIYETKVNNEEIEYLEMLNTIVSTGSFRKTRNGNTWSCFGTHLKFNLEESFPLLTTKKMFLRGIFEELKFFLMGQTNTKLLEDKKVFIWKGNTTREFLDSVGLNNLNEGDMGPLYGFQLRHYGAEYHGCNYDYTGKGYDQFLNVLHLLKTDKYSRRIMMTTFNPAQISQGPLPPCHGIVVQFGIEGTNKLSCHMYQRSSDSFLGIPFNISSYALLVHIICELVNNDESYNGEKLIPGMLTISIGDYHIYEPHLSVVVEQIERIPCMFPQLVINKKIKKIDELNFEDLMLLNYKSHDGLKADMVA